MRGQTYLLLVASAFLAQVKGQDDDDLITTTNALGLTIIEQTTTDALGDPITNIIQTLPPGVPGVSTPSLSSPSFTSSSPSLTTPSQTSSSSSSTSSTPLATAPPVPPGQQGPVGAPAPLPVQGETPFVYTTTDADGNFITVSATFTPSFPATTPFTPTTTGTILGYSQWLAQLGNATSVLDRPVSSSPVSGAPPRLQLDFGAVVIWMAGLAVGTIVVLH